ncbi:MAG: hypothetical protein ABI835_20135, partial [Chloroflexota bacterium]
TIYLQAQPDGVMTVTMVEGQVEVTALGTTVTVPAGNQVTIPMNADLQPSGPPSETQPNDPAQIDALPVDALEAVAQPTAVQTLEVTPPSPERCIDLLNRLKSEFPESTDYDYDDYYERLSDQMADLQANTQTSREEIEALQQDMNDLYWCL